jgi:hypothetical protein
MKAFDWIIFAPGTEREKFLVDARAAGWTGEAVLYQLIHGLHDPATKSYPQGQVGTYKTSDGRIEIMRGLPRDTTANPNWNNAAFDNRTLIDIRDNYPDIFVLYPDGTPVRKNERRDYLIGDIRHSRFQSIVRAALATLLKRNPSVKWNRIFIDDGGVMFRPNAVGPVATRQYGKADSGVYHRAVLEHLARLRAWASELGVTLSINLQGPQSLEKEWKASVDAACVSGAGAILLEFSMVPRYSSGGGWYPVSEWEWYLEKSRYAASKGVVWNNIPVQAEQAYNDPEGAEGQRAWFGAASVALTVQDNGCAGIRFADPETSYGSAYDFSTHPALTRIAELGKPTGSAACVGLGVWERPFEHGKLRVDGNKHTAEIIKAVAPTIADVVVPELESGQPIRIPVQIEDPQGLEFRVSLTTELPGAVYENGIVTAPPVNTRSGAEYIFAIVATNSAGKTSARTFYITIAPKAQYKALLETAARLRAEAEVVEGIANTL